jgi:hypothetical protein
VVAAPDENGWSNIELPKETKWKNIGTERPERGGFEVKNAALSAVLQAGRLALSKQQLEAFALPYEAYGYSNGTRTLSHDAYVMAGDSYFIPVEVQAQQDSGLDIRATRWPVGRTKKCTPEVNY